MRSCLIRHDVDRKPGNALKMAEIEAQEGIKSTYYFRVKRGVFKPKIIRKIAALDHEIGYHYEVMDKGKGDIGLAQYHFEKDLKKLRQYADVKTCAMHGNPLTKWDNKAFWEHFNLSHFRLTGEAYLGFKDDTVHYTTDTGRGWNKAKHNIKDKAVGSMENMPPMENTNYLMSAIKRQEFADMYLQIHPERWAYSYTDWVIQWGKDKAINFIKGIIARRRK